MSAARILVVDDNPLNIELVNFVLGSAGFACEVVTDATQVLAVVAACQPELILMDIQMPNTDGLQLTQQIKADPATRHIIIVAFTAYAMKGDEVKMRAAGCDGYVSKPINVATFADQIRSYLAAASA
jgi:two-component system cell cycle response regulator DivK